MKKTEEKGEIGKLKESIEFIQRLINQMNLEEKNKKNTLNYEYRKSHQFLSSFKKLNSFKEHPSLQRNVGFKENKTNREFKPKFEENDSNFSDINIAGEHGKNDKQPFRDYIETQRSNKSTKNSIIKRNKRDSFLPRIYTKYNFSNKNIIPILPISLKTDINFKNRKKFSHKTKFNDKNKSKDNIKDRDEQPLFARTQVKDKKLNKYYLSYKKRNFESRNKSHNNIYQNTFSNKTEFFDFTYRRLKRGNFEGINKLVKKYLNEVEQKTDEEIDMILQKYDYKNFKVNLKELEIYMRKKEIDRKTEKLYLNNFISKRVAKPLETMRKKEEQISRLNKIITAVGNHTE